MSAHRPGQGGQQVRLLHQTLHAGDDRGHEVTVHHAGVTEGLPQLDRQVIERLLLLRLEDRGERGQGVARVEGQRVHSYQLRLQLLPGRVLHRLQCFREERPQARRLFLRRLCLHRQTVPALQDLFVEGGEIGGNTSEPSADLVGEDPGVAGEEVPDVAAAVAEDGAAAAEAGAAWAHDGLA